MKAKKVPQKPQVAAKKEEIVWGAEKFFGRDVGVPNLHANHFGLVAAQFDFTLMFASCLRTPPKPSEVICTVSISPALAKRVAYMLVEAVNHYEGQTGEICGSGVDFRPLREALKDVR